MLSRLSRRTTKHSNSVHRASPVIALLSIVSDRSNGVSFCVLLSQAPKTEIEVAPAPKNQENGKRKFLSDWVRYCKAARNLKGWQARRTAVARDETALARARKSDNVRGSCQARGGGTSPSRPPIGIASSQTNSHDRVARRVHLCVRPTAQLRHI